MYNLLVILGPTATGKTRLAALVASQINGEVISADSRQVYKGMDIGSGKDLQDYNVDGISVPYHLIDIAKAGEEYNVFRFRTDFNHAYQNITSRKKFPILCGGTGLYIQSVLGNYSMAEVPGNNELRTLMVSKSNEELISWLTSLRKLHSTTDTVDRKRLYRAIEIEEFQKNQASSEQSDNLHPIIIGIQLDRNLVRGRITLRLKQRLENGMIEEVEALIKKGVPIEQLIAYGLEYKYICLYLQNQLTYEEMFRLLNIAIHQFAKRQMTWYRRMEKQVYQINWVDGTLSDEMKVSKVMDLLKAGEINNSILI
jgi:tRNA dimethylallyltransferase